MKKPYWLFLARPIGLLTIVLLLVQFWLSAGTLHRLPGHASGLDAKASAHANRTASGVPPPVDTSPPKPTYTPTFTSTRTPAPCGSGSNYAVVQSSGVALVPGTALVAGSQCDECSVSVTLPFPFRFYGAAYSRAVLG